MKVKIQVDSREKANKQILKAFKDHQIHYEVCKLDVGDYQMVYGDYISDTVIERKRLTELAGNVIEAKDKKTGLSRFERELERCKEAGLRMIILIEDGQNWYEDILTHKYMSRMKPASFRALLLTYRARYNLEIVGVPNEYMGSFIYQSLYYCLRDELKAKGMKLK